MINGLEALKNMSILYAEDDDKARESTVKTLSMFFKIVKAVDNGADALKVYENYKPNIVMLDIRMPYVNGLEVAKIIRQTDEITPIILNTSYRENEDLMKAIKLNLADYLIKPFSFEELRLSFVEVLERMNKQGLIWMEIEKGMRYDFSLKSISMGDERVTLTKNEIIILEQLLAAKGSLVSYSRLEDALGFEFHSSKASIKNTILRLRKKIGKDKIVNVQDLGYMLP